MQILKQQPGIANKMYYKWNPHDVNVMTMSSQTRHNLHLMKGIYISRGERRIMSDIEHIHPLVYILLGREQRSTVDDGDSVQCSFSLLCYPFKPRLQTTSKI